MKTKSTHGGRRAGAGRPPATPGGTRPHTVTLSDTEWAYLRRVGNGNASAGLRELVKNHGAISHKKMYILGKMYDMYMLGDDWDGEGTNGLDSDVLLSMTKLTLACIHEKIVPYFIAPIEGGGCQIEWKGKDSYFEVECCSMDKYNVILIENDEAVVQKGVPFDLVMITVCAWNEAQGKRHAPVGELTAMSEMVEPNEVVDKFVRDRLRDLG